MLLLGKEHILLADVLQVLVLLLLVQVIEVMVVMMQVVGRDEFGFEFGGCAAHKDFAVSGRCGGSSVIAHLRVINGTDASSSRFLDE